jgi:regulator of replication initiation timing
LKLRFLHGTMTGVLQVWPAVGQAPPHHTKGRNEMAKQAVAHAVDLEPIDRLEEKVTRLVTMVGELRTAQARAQEENVRLGEEIEALRARLADADAASSELLALRDERDVIRSRVSEMLQQLEAL